VAAGNFSCRPFCYLEQSKSLAATAAQNTAITSPFCFAEDIGLQTKKFNEAVIRLNWYPLRVSEVPSGFAEQRTRKYGHTHNERKKIHPFPH